MQLQAGSKAVLFRVLKVLLSRENHGFWKIILDFGANLAIFTDFGANLGIASARRKDGKDPRKDLEKIR